MSPETVKTATISAIAASVASVICCAMFALLLPARAQGDGHAVATSRGPEGDLAGALERLGASIAQLESSLSIQSLDRQLPDRTEARPAGDQAAELEQLNRQVEQLARTRAASSSITLGATNSTRVAPVNEQALTSYTERITAWFDTEEQVPQDDPRRELMLLSMREIIEIFGFPHVTGAHNGTSRMSWEFSGDKALWIEFVDGLCVAIHY